MKYTVLFVCLCITQMAFAQSKISGYVLDASNNQAIPFVNIGIKKLGTGTVSDENGFYELETSEPQSRVTFSAIGYLHRTFDWQDLTGYGNIALEPREYLLDTLELKAKKWSEEDLIIGLNHEKRGTSMGFGSTQLGTEIAALIEIEKETFVKSAHFLLNHANGDSMLFRVNIYAFKNGKPGNNLLHENVLIATQQRKGTIDVDLRPFNVVVDHPILLSLEWIKDDGKKGNQGISFRAKKSKRKDNLFVKLSSVGDFKKMSDWIPRSPELELSFYISARQVK